MNNTELIIQLNKVLDIKAINEKIASNFVYLDDSTSEIEGGNYICNILSLKLKKTKTSKIMFTITYKIIKSENNKYIGRIIYFNRVIVGNKSTEKWNDGKALKSIIEYLFTLGYSIIFNGYEEFNNDLSVIFEELKDKSIYITYRPDAFTNANVIGIRDKDGNILKYEKE